MTLSYFVHIHYIVFLPPCFALDICIMWATSGIRKILKKSPKGYNKTIKLIIWFAAQQLTLNQLVKSRLWHNGFMASALVVAIHRLSCQETRLQIPDNDFLVTCLHVFKYWCNNWVIKYNFELSEAWYYSEGEIYHIYDVTMSVLPWCFL